ncbi:hypothetical protein C2G38_2048601 [Gigaspora rosea]|uniref:Galactose oxidase n=1 Tax=Gigaspora rosea TaxID=44941 RepID=A0A397U1W1_9GLOM|nr:hypothetical protein C2G38_2048601 [Gigaspora rosea]
MSYFNLYIFAFLLNFIFTFAGFTPLGRTNHKSVLVDKKLYIYSGQNLKNLYDFFYLDFSQNFTTTADLQWNNLNLTGSPRKMFETACIGGNNNDLIFIFGNENGTDNEFTFTSKFDTRNQQWSFVTSGVNGPVWIDGGADLCANFNNGSIAVIAGAGNVSQASDIWIFDSLKSKWSLRNSPNKPEHLVFYRAITLPDQTILYIGGSYDAVSLNSLFLYDTASNTWKNLTTSGTTPPSRICSSAVLTSDKRIIMFGGASTDNFKNVFGDLWILDIETYQWSEGNISNPNGITLALHTATLVDDYMIIAFGTYDNIGNLSSTIYMLDVSQRNSYKWVTEFIPRTTNTANFN